MKQMAFMFFLMALLVTACKNNDVKESNPEEGKVLTLDEFYASPEDYKDKEITLTAIVDHVCKHGGKKLFLVSDENDIHVESEEERFTEDLAGKTIELKGIVREFRVDEAYCLKREEDNMQAHRDQKTNEEAFKAEKENIQYYRDSMKVAGVDYLSYWSIDYLSLKELDK